MALQGHGQATVKVQSYIFMCVMADDIRKTQLLL